MDSLFDIQYTRWCCVINFSFLFFTLLLVRCKYTVFLGYVKYLLLAAWVILTICLMAMNSSPLGTSYFHYTNLMPKVESTGMTALSNDLFLCLFFALRHHLQIIQTPKIFVIYHQAILLLFYIILGIVAVP